MRNLRLFQSLRFALFFCAFSWLTACSSSVVVSTLIPDPVIDPLPLRLGIYYGPKLSGFVFSDKIPVTGERWEIDLGAKQIDAFDKAFSAMFAEVEKVESLEAISGGASSVYMHPAMEDFQFSTPKQNLGNFFEAWLRYDLRMLDAEGALIANWPLTAYGKTEDGLFETASAGMHQAISEALRDLVAVFMHDFFRDTRVQDWLDATGVENRMQPAATTTEK